jgi:hypothetical protein
VAAIDLQALRLSALTDILHRSVSAIRTELTGQLLDGLQSKVSSGPFAGMRLLSDTSWSDGDLAPKILGCYEEELHAAIQKAVERNPVAIVNVGCAEGYYAIGLARLLPKAKIHAFDISEKAQAACRSAAVANSVLSRVAVGGARTTETLRPLVERDERTLMVMDCEGAELALLNPDLIAGMGRCDVIVECHDFVDASITATLTQRFAGSHEVERIDGGGRNPNRHHALQQLGELYRWILVNENRPVTMNWLACWAR